MTLDGLILVPFGGLMFLYATILRNDPDRDRTFWSVQFHGVVIHRRYIAVHGSVGEEVV